jgi:small subunit ribosomal protein S6
VRSYELMYMVHPSVDEDGLNAIIDRVKGFITRNGGKVSTVEPWGSRRLAYPIQNERDGQYVLCYFDLPADQVVAVEHDLGLTEEIMRHLIVRREEEAQAKTADA